jgi:hypothetical protein
MNPFSSGHLRFVAAAFGLAVLVLTAAPLAAQTAVSNFGAGSGGTANIGFDANGYNARRTFSFTTGANSGGYSFSSLTMSFNNVTGSPGSLSVGLYSAFDSASGSSPTGLLSSLSVSSGNPASAGNVVFSGTTTLAASTTYFLLLAAPSASSTGNYFTYHTASTTNEDSGGLAGWLIGDIGYIANSSGGVWSDGGGAMMSIQASAIPEPSTYAAIAGAAMLGLAVWRRRRQSAPASVTPA